MFHSSNPTLFGRTAGVLGESEVLWRTIGGECPGLVERVRALCEGRERLRLSVTSVRRSAFRTTDAAELGFRIHGVLDGLEAHADSECQLLQNFFIAGGNQADGRAGAS